MILWEPMASAIAATYPRQRIFVVQPSVLDLLNCVRQVPEGKSCGVIIPLSLRAYYDDLEVQFKAMGVTFYCLASDTDERALRASVHQAALSGIQWLVVSAGVEDYVRAEGMEYITLQPKWGGLVRAFFKVLWSLRQSRLSQKKTPSSPRGMTAYYHLDDIIGHSQMMKQVKCLSRIYAVSESTILITGESGTGKEMLAQAIHNMSNRRGRSLPSTAVLSQKASWKANFLAILADPLQEPAAKAVKAFLKRPMGERYSSMKSGTCRMTCRTICCGSCRNAAFAALALIRPFPSMFALLPQPIRI